jgi:hypothetical protein
MMRHDDVVRRLEDLGCTSLTIHRRRGSDVQCTNREFANVLLAEEQIIDNGHDLYRDRHGDTVDSDTQMQRTDHEIEDQPRKPACPLVGTDGNVFAVIARVRRCLEGDGQPERAKEFVKRATSATSYDAVLQLVFQYCDPM